MLKKIVGGTKRVRQNAKIYVGRLEIFSCLLSHV